MSHIPVKHWKILAITWIGYLLSFSGMEVGMVVVMITLLPMPFLHILPSWLFEPHQLLSFLYSALILVVQE